MGMSDSSQVIQEFLFASSEVSIKNQNITIIGFCIKMYALYRVFSSERITEKL